MAFILMRLVQAVQMLRHFDKISNFINVTGELLITESDSSQNMIIVHGHHLKLLE
jgi:hypothetical protein